MLGLKYFRKKIKERENLKKTFNNISWLFFDKVLRLGGGFFIGVWVARYLGPSQFGLYNFTIAVVGLFAVPSGLGLYSIVVRELIINPESKYETLGTGAFLQMFSGFISYVMLLFFISCIRPGDKFGFLLISIFGITLLFKFNEIALCWFESQVLSKYIVWAQSAAFIFFFLIKVSLILCNARLLYFIIASAAEAFFSALLIIIVMQLKGVKVEKLRASLSSSYFLLRESWPLLLTNFAIIIYMKIDQIMIGQMLDDKAVGIYSIATRISEVWYFIPMMVVSSLTPSIIASKAVNETLFNKRMQMLYDLMICISVPVAIFLTFTSFPLVYFIFGSDYSEAAEILSIHIWTSIFVFLGVASSQWFLAVNKNKLLFWRSFIGMIFNVILNYFLIPKHGPKGAAIATLISQAIVGFFFDLASKETRAMFFMKARALNLFRVVSYLK